MKTATLYENGDTFEITYKTATGKEPIKNYILIDEVLHELINKIKTNAVTVPKKRQLDVLPDDLDEVTKQSLTDTPELIKYLQRYEDEYSKELLKIFVSYLEHKDYNRMYKEYDKTDPKDNIMFYNRWDINTRMVLSEVTIPEV